MKYVSNEVLAVGPNYLRKIQNEKTIVLIFQNRCSYKKSEYHLKKYNKLSIVKIL